ncbi:Vacuolar protein sorting-associated protein [Ceraceosorus bombacis]|uniref:Vacuolar protein sorting-associated protein n=1 Tax=Ceraceosorus bombacis TaxID=401625 RepID=A0A0P1BCL7_9BASI|nr:Vacuolar protein sorting-associated protein [Ceraceosorus bombacis]
MLEGVLASVLNRFLASYVDGLNTSQLNVGIWSGDVKLRNLRLKTSALDKFRLPIDVKEGFLGDLTLSIPWSNLKGKPVRVLVENVYLLAAPKEASVEIDDEEEEERAQAAKLEKLANAELLGTSSSIGVSEADAQKNESFTSSLVTKIVDNLQITVRNIHVRYEDKLSNPEHPFSAGLTLAEFSAVSTDADWNPTFIQNSQEGIHKLARLESLAAYWDTDAESLAGYEVSEAQQRFASLIARDGQIPRHQYILHPVTGAGRLVMRRKMTPDIAKMDAQLLFDSLGFALDDEQYRDVISVADLFHFYTRQAQYRRYRPAAAELEENKPRAMLRFAARAILNEVHEKRKVWTWAYFAQRRDERKEYVELFKQKEQAVHQANQNQGGAQIASSEEGTRLHELERTLSYKDIRFYRSIARHELRKERTNKRKEELASGNRADSSGSTAQASGAGAAAGGGWLEWIWGGGANKAGSEHDSGVLNEEQRKELYDAIEWDESANNQALTSAVDLPGDALQLRLTTKLQTGSLSLKDHSRGSEIVSLVFDSLQADVDQRVDNLEAAVSLGGLRVYDNTTANSLYPQIVRVKDDEINRITQVEGRTNSRGQSTEQAEHEVGLESDPDNPFFYLKFENKPLDRRADSALAVKMRSMEIIYHRGYVENIVRFFKPPESELELIGALIDVASETIEGIRKETRAGLENALENHKTIDLTLDIKAPIIIVPQDVTQRQCQHIVLDAGHIGMRSVFADQSALDTVKSKQSKQYTEDDYRQLEDLMYDRFFVKLESMQLVMGPDIESCLSSLTAGSEHHASHLVERINLDFTLHNSILPKAPNLTKFKITGHLPSLRVNFSDNKYKALMSVIDVAIPKLDDDPVDEEPGKLDALGGRSNVLGDAEVSQIQTSRNRQPSADDGRGSESGLDLNKVRRQRIASQMRGGDDYLVEQEDDDAEGEAEFEDAEDDTADRINAHQRTFELHFVVDSLQGSIYKSSTDPSKPDRLLVEAVFEGFLLHLAVFPYHMEIDVGLRSLELEDKIVDQGAVFKHLITSKAVDTRGKPATASKASTPDKDLVRVKYVRVQTDSPEFQSVYEGIDQSIHVELSTINITLTRVSVLVVYDWIMNTFVPPESAAPPPEKLIDVPQGEDENSKTGRKEIAEPVTRKEMLRVRVKLTSIVLRINNDGQLLATLTLSTAEVAVLLRGNSIRVAARLGSLLLVDNVQREDSDSGRKKNPGEFKKLLSIDGDELADFTYETFDEQDKRTYPGYDTSIWLRTGSLKFTFAEEPVRDLLNFFNKFARMKAVYDAATQAASAQATQLQERVAKLHYDVVIKTPIVNVRRGPGSSDVLTANLGEIYAYNTFSEPDDDHVTTKIEAGLRHIRLASRMTYGSQEYKVQMIDDVNISVDVTQRDHLGHAASTGEKISSSAAHNLPDMSINARMSDVQIKLTEQQYGFIMALTQAIPRAFVLDEDDDADNDQAVSSIPSTSASSVRQVPAASTPSSAGPGVDMLPELGVVAHDSDGNGVLLRTSLDMLFNVRAIGLELFSSGATAQDKLQNASLAKFSLNQSAVKLKMLSDSSLEAEVALKSFTVSDTRPDKGTKFREIIPAVRHDGHQFMLSYTQSGNQSDRGALALVTVDSPKIIFSLDPLFALVNFFASAFNEADTQMQDDIAGANSDANSTRKSTSAVRSQQRAPTKKSAPSKTAQQSASGGSEPADGGSAIAFRVNVVDPTIILLAAPERTDSEAIVLSIRQILVSQQAILALKVDQFGMFMCRMDRPKDSLRFLDNFDLTLSLDSRGSGSRQVTSIEVDVEPLVLRVSFKDIMLISSVVNKAIELSNQSNSFGANQDGKQNPASRREASAMSGNISLNESAKAVAPRGRSSSASARNSSHDDERPSEAELIVAKELLKADVAGLQLILIGDMHSLPMLDLNLRRFSVNVRDWSSEMRVRTSIGMHVNYNNLSRSHWEPLIDPWVVDFGMDSVNGTTTMTVSSKKRLEVNVTTTLIETAMTTAAIMAEEQKKLSNASASANTATTSVLRESQAPFLVRNRTGYRITLWAEHEDRRVKASPHRLEDGSDTPWRFDDWKAMREHVMQSGGNMLSLQVEGMPWERIKHVSVDREGESLITLHPKVEKVAHRMLCDVKLVDNVKVVTFRSSFNIENRTMVPVEFVVLGSDGEPTQNGIRQLAPGEDCPVPIEAAYHNRIRLRPDPGFEYGWSNEAFNWQELLKKSTRVVSCDALHEGEAPFRFQCFAITEKQDALSRAYPRLTLRLRAPVEVENLLPYDIQYRIFDRNLNHNWNSFLRKGGTSPIHVVETSHLLLLSVDIQSSVFSPSEFAIIATDNGDDFPVEKTMTLADAENLKLNLRLHYSKYPDSGGAFKVSIFAPYIFINQTGLPFALKTKSWIGGAKLVAGQEQGEVSEVRKHPEPFLFSHNSNDRRNRVLLRVGDSSWSKPLSFEAIGSDSEVVIPSASRNEEIHLGLNIQDGLGKFKLSKVVKLTPRYLVRNNLGETLNLREPGAADFVTVEAGRRVPLHFLRVGASKQMTLAYPGLNNKWTAPFNIEDIGSVHLRIAKAGDHQHLIKAEVMLEGPTIFISLSMERGQWPFMLRNESDHVVTFMQATERSDERNGDKDEAVGKRYELKPRSKMKYAWDFPALPNKLIKLVANGRERSVNVLEIGTLMPFKFPSTDGRGSRVIALDVRADGATQTLVLSPWTEEKSGFRLKRQNSTFSRTDTVSSTGRDGGFEAVDVDSRITMVFNVEFEGVGISVINRSVQELAYVSFRGLEFHYNQSEKATSVGVVCKWIQVDNQLFGGLFPIVLYPAVLREGKELDQHPVLQLSWIQSTDETHGASIVKYASVLLQEISVELDEDFLFALIDFSKLQGASWQKDAALESDFVEDPREVPEPSGTLHQPADTYFEVLHLQPLAINLSFMRTDMRTDRSDERVGSRNPVLFAINAISMALGNLNEAPIRLNALVLENVRLSSADLQARLTTHYTQALVGQLYRVMGSLDVIGNPVGLFNNVSGGFVALWYEPYQGLVMHGNRELGMGLVRGASAFAKGAVFGVSDSMSKVTGSIGKGLAAATMDPEFQSRRRMTRFRNKPKHALYGLSSGASAFFTSIASGLSGVALKPIEGAERGGAVGFARGLLAGSVGLVTKPLVGTFDFASNLTEGVRNTTVVFDQNEIDRVRLPRFIAADGIVRPYSAREALGQTWLRCVDDGRLYRESYVCHVDLGQAQGQANPQPERDGVIMVTLTRILFIRTLRMKVAWEVPLSDLASISLESDGIALTLRNNVAGPFLKLPEAGARSFLFSSISRVVRAYNAQHQS